MEEDWNALAADCVVISCCCQCLILQIVVFVLLRLPYKLIRKTRELAKRRLGRRRKPRSKAKGMVESMKCRCGEDHGWMILDGLSIEVDDGDECMKEVEKVLGELVERGEFAFGSFWGRGSCRQQIGSSQSQGFDFTNVVHFHLIEVVGPRICKT
ncbi:uncharacterized protein LOC116210907 [Punica granatum]|uniref:Uncharacterized protein LOC116210907 n=1 Tax=Punica granatum TaxID=22663 RepID=A0A6P8DZB3_PUNGR|nr:uncharacterized protein LOC116210907 [Punica granatum]